MKKIILIGASGHGKVIADIAIKNGYEIVGFLDDNEEIKQVMGFPVVGRIKDFSDYINAVEYVVCIGNAIIRKTIQDELINNNCKVATLIHPNAVIGMNVTIGQGSVVMAGAVINSDTIIGDGCIVNTGATVDHDCKIGDYVHIAVGAHIAGMVSVGQETWVGAGAIIKNCVNVCAGCMIGAGAVVVNNLYKEATYIGVPAKINVKVEN